MKFFAASLAIAAVNSQDQILAGPSTGLLNYHWTEMYHCPDFTTVPQIEDIAINSQASNMTFENWAQHCAELSYGLSAEYAPCVQTAYFPGGIDGGSEPYYGCMAYPGEYLVKGDLNGQDMQNLKNNRQVNINDENNRIAACINDSPPRIAGAYSCSRGPLMIGAEYVTLGAAAALSLASMM